MREQVFVSVDVETDGPIPGDYSLLSIGAVLVDQPAIEFYRELRPVSDRFVPEAVAITGLDRDRLRVAGDDPVVAMRAFARWIAAACPPRARPVFVGFNATFDWMFVHWYFVHFVGEDPFGISGLDIKAYYMGAVGCERWADTAKRKLDPRFASDAKYTHHALEDAREQAEIFRRVRAFRASSPPLGAP